MQRQIGDNFRQNEPDGNQSQQRKQADEFDGCNSKNKEEVNLETIYSFKIADLKKLDIAVLESEFHKFISDDHSFKNLPNKKDLLKLDCFKQKDEEEIPEQLSLSLERESSMYSEHLTNVANDYFTCKNPFLCKLVKAFDQDHDRKISRIFFLKFVFDEQLTIKDAKQFPEWHLFCIQQKLSILYKTVIDITTKQTFLKSVQHIQQNLVIHSKLEDKIKLIFRKFFKYFQKEKLEKMSNNVSLCLFEKYLTPEFTVTEFQEYFRKIPHSKNIKLKDNSNFEMAIPKHFTLAFLRKIAKCPSLVDELVLFYQNILVNDTKNKLKEYLFFPIGNFIHLVSDQNRMKFCYVVNEYFMKHRSKFPWTVFEIKRAYADIMTIIGNSKK